jgi:hypothetical protein
MPKSRAQAESTAARRRTETRRDCFMMDLRF